MLAVVQQGRDASVRQAIPYTPDVLAETGQVAPGVGDLNPNRFTVSAPDGRPMGSLLDESVIGVKVAIRDGATVDEALRSGGSHLIRDVLTVLADTRRQVFGADITQRPAIGGYARMLNTPSCSRCVLLAGRWYRWNQGFQRHPRCDCMHIPSAENRAGDFRTDPKAYFDSLSAGEQDRVFTKSGAKAIRDGADMSRVENTRLRGLGTETSHRKYGTPYRLTVDDIYKAAGTRDDAIRLLLMEGYIRPPV